MESPRPKAVDIDEYIAGFPPATQERLQQVRATIKAVMPEADEVISYAIPTFKLNGRPVIYFSGFDKHIGLYPLPKSTSEKFAKELEPHIHGKGTARFYLDQPLPLELIKEYAQYKLQEATS